VEAARALGVVHAAEVVEATLVAHEQHRHRVGGYWRGPPEGLAVTLDVLRVAGDRLRVGAWRGDDGIAYVAPVTDSPAPTREAVRACCDVLASRGFHEVVTAALAPREAHGFVLSGFEVRERLHLLAHDLLDLPEPPPVHHRRARRADRPDVLSVDGTSFGSFWRLDADGLQEALTATPTARFRVVDVDGVVVAYAVCGRAGARGFIQRLAVDPTRRRAGVGAALVVDGLRWMRRWGADRAVVNTQEENAAALALYERLGFRRQPGGLAVLTARL
jgi:ribosomal protein S18 acetylase RimI-like enzyme